MPSSALAASAAVTPGTISIGDAGGFECRNFLLRTTEQHRVATLEPNDDTVLGRGIDETLVDEFLRGRVLAAAFSHRDLFGVLCQGDGGRMHQRVVEHDVGALEQPCSSQRQQVRRTGSGAHQVYGPAIHAINPAATVLLLDSSMSMKLPVARLSA